ncbi:hypothetical protein BDW72DRAFT_187608 [Aspergillus terricola var. indicus]
MSENAERGSQASSQSQRDKAVEPQSRPIHDDPSQSTEKKNSSLLSVINDGFIREIFGMAIAVGVFVALVVVLAEYDQKQQPDWGSMSLNAVISWMSTVLRACIAITCSEVLGQLKWVWFAQKARPISELRTFDSASRGIYGALELIWTLRAKHFAGLAGLAAILALAIDPFAQNLVHYYPDLVDDSTQRALIGNASTYIQHGAQVVAVFAAVDPILKSNIYNSLFNNDPQTPWAIPQYSCPSANCTWEPAVALEARTLCANITDQLSTSCRVMGPREQLEGLTNCTIKLPSSNLTAWYVRSDDRLPWMKGFVVGSVMARDNAAVYKNFTTTAIQYIAPRLSGNWWASDVPPANTTWEATECTIEPIVRSFRASVTNNIYADETLAIWNNYTMGSDPTALGYAFNPPWGSALGMQQHNQTFTYGVAANQALSYFLTTSFGGYFWRTQNLQQGYNPDYSGPLYAPSDVLQALAMGDIVGCSDQLATRLNCTMVNVALAVSKSFRDSMYSADPGDNSTGVAVGRVRVNATFISVQWEWLALPVFVWIVAVVALIGTLWKIRRGKVPSWRNDPVPLLFLYSGEEVAQSQSHSDGVPVHGDHDFDDVKVRLCESTGRMVLSQQ